MNSKEEVKALEDSEIDNLLEAAAKYDLLAEQFHNGNNVERAMVDLLEKVGTVLRRCHKTIRNTRTSRPETEGHVEMKRGRVEELERAIRVCENVERTHHNVEERIGVVKVILQTYLDELLSRSQTGQKA